MSSASSDPDHAFAEPAGALEQAVSRYEAALPEGNLSSTAPGDLLSGRLGAFDLLYLDLASERAQTAGSTSSRWSFWASRWRR